MAQVHWLNAVNGTFETAAAWSTGATPGPSDDVILDAAGPAYDVSQGFLGAPSATVNSVQTAANATLSAANLVVTDGTGSGANAGTLSVLGLTVSGTVDNTGEIEMTGNFDVSGTVNLIGGGTVIMHGGAFGVAGEPAPATLINVDNTIVGDGIFSNLSTVINEAGGVIDASDSVTSGRSFIGDTSTTLENAGLVEATDNGTLQLFGPIDNSGTVLDVAGTVYVAGGTNSGQIEATGGSLYLFGGTYDDTAGGVILADGGLISGTEVTIDGGLLESENGGTFEFTSAVTLDGSAAPLAIEGVVRVLDSAFMELDGAIDNSGKLKIASTGDSTTLSIAATGATLSGGGLVGLSGPKAILTGAAPGAPLENVDDLIRGAGLLGNGKILFTNDAAGKVQATGAMTLDTGANAIVNDGVIKSVDAGSLTIDSAITNGGKLKVTGGGSLLANAAVTGGELVINGGTARFASTFTGDVVFNGPGQLVLAQSQSYGGSVTGFSTSGANSLDLGDIGFVSASEATFVPNASGGVLTVSDGSHTANVTLIGDYSNSTFIASSDGSGGTIVVDPSAAPISHGASAHAFSAAMTSLGVSSSPSVAGPAPTAFSAPPMLAAGRLVQAA